MSPLYPDPPAMLVLASEVSSDYYKLINNRLLLLSGPELSMLNFNIEGFLLRDKCLHWPSMVCVANIVEVLSLTPVMGYRYDRSRCRAENEM